VKIISKDRTFIDYLGTKFGVRVHRISCRPVVTTASGKWEPYDHDYSIPVAETLVSLPLRQMDSITALAHAVSDYEQYQHGDSEEDKAELRKLIMGGTDFKTAVETPSVYQQIFEYAAYNGISLEEGYIVWVINGGKVMPSPDDKTHRLTFADMTAATAFAEKHNAKLRVFVTGPSNMQWFEIPTDRRRL
jgi:hypothetical protein